MENLRYYATGKRKTSVARVWLEQGEGNIFINKRPIEQYFPQEYLRTSIIKPLQLINGTSQYNILVNVHGGGIVGQSGAVKHGIAKALLSVNPAFREKLKKNGLLTRDAREKERKKYGQKGARKRFQYSKR
ncbi:MAG: 30S ribosomal protein S9 [Nitrospirota bacterium]